MGTIIDSFIDDDDERFINKIKMAVFNLALEKVLKNEGVYSNDPSDKGGETYKGIARNIWSKWEGWAHIDAAKYQKNFPACLESDEDMVQMVSSFYFKNFWEPIGGMSIVYDEVAFAIFDFAVNAGVGTSKSLAKVVSNSDSYSVNSVNCVDRELFLANFTIAKLIRYVNIVEKRPDNKKFFYGWVRRSLGLNG